MCCKCFVDIHIHVRNTTNAEFIAAYNRTVADEGLPLEDWRNF